MNLPSSPQSEKFQRVYHVLFNTTDLHDDLVRLHGFMEEFPREVLNEYNRETEENSSELGVEQAKHVESMMKIASRELSQIVGISKSKETSEDDLREIMSAFLNEFSPRVCIPSYMEYIIQKSGCSESAYSALMTVWSEVFDLKEEKEIPKISDGVSIAVVQRDIVNGIGDVF